VFYRYLKVTDFDYVHQNKILCLAATSIMIGAKLEEPMKPSFLKIIDIIEEEEIMDISK
jgi:hypothetical protein